MVIRAKVPISYSVGFLIGYPVGEPFFWMGRFRNIPFITRDGEKFITSDSQQFFVKG